MFRYKLRKWCDKFICIFVEDTKDNIIEHIKYLIKYIRENYDFEKCQIKMSDVGSVGAEMFMLNVFAAIEDLANNEKYEFSTWWYGFSKKIKKSTIMLFYI